jgi:hypothetical protein
MACNGLVTRGLGVAGITFYADSALLEKTGDKDQIGSI